MLPLKEATSAKHKLAERMPFNARMFRGLLTKDQYALYLNQQLEIFAAIESIGLPHNGLTRKTRVQADIDELKAQGHSSDLVLHSAKTYGDYLRSLSYEEILPHVYLNYMALIFGGQMIKKSVPSGGQMYAFDAMQEVIQAIRAVQRDEWADEVNKGFDFNIQIFEELEAQCLVEN
jgi:heme oxygenase